MKKCVYTALTGGYDNLMQPQCVAADYDYICFSNDILEDKVGVWQIRPIPFKHRDNTRVSRYPKFHPHVLLKEYDYCIYIDANNLILDDFIYIRADELYSQHEIVGHVIHPYRNCVYKEIFDCMYYGSDRTWQLIKSLRLHIHEKFPRDAGLFENNLIYWTIHSPELANVLDLFWNIYLSSSRRDQLSLRLAYFKENIQPALFLPKGEHMGNSAHIRRIEHVKKDSRYSTNRHRMIINKLKIRLVRAWFLLQGHDFTYKKLYSD